MFYRFVSSEFIQKITAIPKSMDEVLVIRTNQSILLCNDTVFLFPSVWGYRGCAVEKDTDVEVSPSSSSTS